MTARLTSRADAKAGLNDPAVKRGIAVAQRIKGTPGITGSSCPRVHIDGRVWHLDVGSSHPGAGVGPKGWAVRPLKRYASWVQNVVRQWITALSINLAICWKLRASDATCRQRGSENALGADNQQGRPAKTREPSETARQTGPRGLEDTVRAAWRHAESGRNDLAPEPLAREQQNLSVPIHHGRWKLERSRL